MERMHYFGLALASFGAIFSAVSQLILLNVPFTALGLGSIILGFSILLTPSRPVPRAAVKSLMEGSVLGFESLLEEFNISHRGYYVKTPEGRVRTYIPVSEPAKPPNLEALEEPRGVVVEVDGRPYIVLTPPSSELVELVEADEPEPAIAEALVDLSELCESVKVVEAGDMMVLEVKGFRSSVAAGRFTASLGSLEASVAAAVTAKIMGVPVRVESEDERGSTKIIRLRLFKP